VLCFFVIENKKRKEGKEMPEWLNTKKGQDLVREAFKAAGMPEVKETDLETGTYTNQQIAEKFEDPMMFLTMLMQLPGDDPVVKRSVLSMAVDMQQQQ
jgi:hypothetical protein